MGKLLQRHASLYEGGKIVPGNCREGIVYCCPVWDCMADLFHHLKVTAYLTPRLGEFSCGGWSCKPPQNTCKEWYSKTCL